MSPLGQPDYPDSVIRQIRFNHWDFSEQFRAILQNELKAIEPPNQDFSKQLLPTEMLALSETLRHLQQYLSHSEKITRSFVSTLQHLTDIFHSHLSINESALTLPLVCGLGDPIICLDDLFSALVDDGQLEVFPQTFDLLLQNIRAASGITTSDSEKPYVFPIEADLAPEQCAVTYFRGTPILDILSLRLPFAFPEEQRFSGHWIVAPSGRGKTTLLHAMLLDDFQRDASIVVIDSKGDLLEPIKHLNALKERLLLVEPNPDYALALNPLDVGKSDAMHAVNMIEYVMAGLLDAKFTALQSTLFRNVVPAIIEAFDHPTLETFKHVMIKGLPADLLERLNPHARAFFENTETGFASKTYESTRKEVVWRLDYLMTNPVLRKMFSAAHTKLDIAREIDAGRIILINNSKALLTDEGAEFFGRFFIALIVRAAHQRSGLPQHLKKPCYVYIDECQTVVAKDTRVPTLLDECRSQNIGLILAHQRTAQLSSQVLDAATNCAIRMVNSDDEAKYLADKIRLPVEKLRSLPRGSFATFVRDFSPLGFVLQVPHCDIGQLPRMTEDEFTAIRDRMQREFSSAPPNVAATSAPQSPNPRAAALGPLTPSDAGQGSGVKLDPGEPAETW